MVAVRAALILALLAATAAAAPAPPPTTCGLGDPYSKALCAYQRRNFAEAEAGFRAIVEADAKDPQTVRATYFLARTLMKTGHFDDAAKLFIRIYSLDKSFYDAWSCDYLLGECRKASGKD
jgi:TolA-binding protein